MSYIEQGSDVRDSDVRDSEVRDSDVRVEFIRTSSTVSNIRRSRAHPLCNAT